MEILIASAILAIGMVMIVALFPFGIKVGKKVVDDTTAIAIARSVADAIRYGMRNNLRYNSRRDGTTYSYFVFQHDGVTDRVPALASQERPEHDYYILLPRHHLNREYPGATEDARRTRAVESGKTFVYPESDPDRSSGLGISPNGGGDPSRADDDGDDFMVTPDFRTILVRKVYELGQTFPGDQEEGVEILDDQKIEVLKQYSFAFSIRTSYFDTNLADTAGKYRPGNELYHVRVMIFRSFYQDFRPESEGSGAPAKPATPVFELDFEVAR